MINVQNFNFAYISIFFKFIYSSFFIKISESILGNNFIILNRFYSIVIKENSFVKLKLLKQRNRENIHGWFMMKFSIFVVPHSTLSLLIEGTAVNKIHFKIQTNACGTETPARVQFWYVHLYLADLLWTHHTQRTPRNAPHATHSTQRAQRNARTAPHAIQCADARWIRRKY